MKEESLLNKNIYLFGHCNATEKLADELLGKGYDIVAILDNSEAKHGMKYRGIEVRPPSVICNEEADSAIVLIVSRFYEEMKKQLRGLGFQGEVVKLLDFNTYAEYSLSEETISRKKARVGYGTEIIRKIEERHPGCFRIFCPLAALGDVYFCMSYLPHFMKKRGISECVICVASKGCSEVVELFGEYRVEVLEQYDLDAAIQASLYMREKNFFIAHQDRPYVINLHKALYIKCIPLEMMYRCGVFGLSVDCEPYMPRQWQAYSRLEEILPGKTVIIAPYAKSVTALASDVWKAIVADYTAKGFLVYTNVTGDELPLEGTRALSAPLSQMKFIVECAGTFIGIRSGLCDVLRDADCKKVALYPDYNYSDTQWKAIDMYRLEGWENIVVEENFEWKRA